MTPTRFNHFRTHIISHIKQADAAARHDPVLMRLHDKAVDRLWAEFYAAGGQVFDEFRIWQEAGIVIAGMVEKVEADDCAATRQAQEDVAFRAEVRARRPRGTSVVARRRTVVMDEGDG